MTPRGAAGDWRTVAALALSVTVAYGVLMYAFPVVLVAMQRELEWSPSLLTGGYGLGLLAGGLAAVPFGWLLDTRDSRGLLIACGLGAAALVAAWAHVHSPAGFYLVWLGLGVCSAGLFYEAAFTIVVKRVRTRRHAALTAVSVAGALASTIFVPLTAALMHRFGWRMAVLMLGGVLGAGTVLPSLMIRSGPSCSYEERASGAGSAPGSPRSDNGGGPRRHHARHTHSWLTAAFFLLTLASVALTVHMVPLLLARDRSLAFAGSVMASLGVMKLAGRVLLVPLAAWMTMPAATTVMILLQAAGVALLTFTDSTAGIWACVLLFGLGDGASTPARAELAAQFHGRARYGTAIGRMALVMSVARAAGAAGAGLSLDVGGTYRPVLLIIAGILLCAGLVLEVGRALVAHPAGPRMRPFRAGSVYLYAATEPQESVIMNGRTTQAADLLEQARRILMQVPEPAPPPVAAACCSTEKQSVCCDPSEKSSCCGADATAGGGCGCQ